jgi:hypothetical protein
MGSTRAPRPCRNASRREAFGELERADNQHETADVRHAARGDRHCRRISDEDGGDSKSQLCGFVARRLADL